MYMRHFILFTTLATLTLTACAPKPMRPALSQTVVTVQRHDAKGDHGGEISVLIDDKETNTKLKDRETKAIPVANGVHFIQVKCPDGESASLNFTANYTTVPFLASYVDRIWPVPNECTLERLELDDDTGANTKQIQQQHYAPAPTSAKESIESPATQIKKWDELRKEGIISEEEFQAKKKQILGL
jgi:hypothetical protein